MSVEAQSCLHEMLFLGKSIVSKLSQSLTETKFVYLLIMDVKRISHQYTVF